MGWYLKWLTRLRKPLERYGADCAASMLVTKETRRLPWPIMASSVSQSAVALAEGGWYPSAERPALSKAAANSVAGALSELTSSSVTTSLGLALI